DRLRPISPRSALGWGASGREPASSPRASRRSAPTFISSAHTVGNSFAPSSGRALDHPGSTDKAKEPRDSTPATVESGACSSAGRGVSRAEVVMACAVMSLAPPPRVRGDAALIPARPYVVARRPQKFLSPFARETPQTLRGALVERVSAWKLPAPRFTLPRARRGPGPSQGLGRGHALFPRRPRRPPHRPPDVPRSPSPC